MLLGSLDDLDQAPALVARERTAFHDADDIADVGFVLFIVRFETRRLANDLAVRRMRDAGLRHDYDRLVHLVRGHAALLHAAVGRPFAMLLHAAPAQSASRK